MDPDAQEKELPHGRRNESEEGGYLWLLYSCNVALRKQKTGETCIRLQRIMIFFQYHKSLRGFLRTMVG